MNFLHTKHVIYFDLKADNVLVWEFPLPNSLYFHKHIGSPPDTIVRYQAISGTSGYIAPEVLLDSSKFDLQPEKVNASLYGRIVD